MSCDTPSSLTKHLYNICTMLDQRRRRWTGVVQMLYKYFVFVTPPSLTLVPLKLRGYKLQIVLRHFFWTDLQLDRRHSDPSQWRRSEVDRTRGSMESGNDRLSGQKHNTVILLSRRTGRSIRPDAHFSRNRLTGFHKSYFY